MKLEEVEKNINGPKGKIKRFTKLFKIIKKLLLKYKFIVYIYFLLEK